jgi:chemotaxis protein methyltransferase CheR
MLQPEMNTGFSPDNVTLSLKDTDFTKISALVHAISGIVLPDNKRPMVQSRLLRRVQALRMSTLSDYVEFVTGPAGMTERSHLLSAVTTNVTAFFRETHHFETLEKTILPALKQSVMGGRRLRLWSAGCSSGEEPYSLAACVTAAIPNASRLDVRILATDIDQTMVEHVRAGKYTSDAVRDLENEWSSRLFGLPAKEVMRRGSAEIAAPLQAMVRCKSLNLQEEWPMKGLFDVIFCRNVVIYFDKQTQERLWSRFAAVLQPGGYLMIGHSERVTGAALSAFSSEGITTYRRL